MVARLTKALLTIALCLVFPLSIGANTGASQWVWGSDRANLTSNTISALDYGMNGTDDSTVDDAIALNLAIDAACALDTADQRTVYIPSGTYYIGATGTNQVYSGGRITCGNIRIVGEGTGTVLKIRGDNGNYVFFVCSSVIATETGACGTELTDIAFENFKIEDDDPWAHGFSGGIIVDEDTVVGDTPAFGDYVAWTGHVVARGAAIEKYESDQLFIGLVDPLSYTFDATEDLYEYSLVTCFPVGATPVSGDGVDWDSGASTGTIVFYDSADNQCGIRILTGTLDDLDDVDELSANTYTMTNVEHVRRDESKSETAGWTTTASTENTTPTTEESHGIGTKTVNRVTFRNITMVDIADEGYDLQLNSKNVHIWNGTSTGCGQVGAGGSCLAVGAGSTAWVHGGTWTGGTGTASPDNAGSIMSLEVIGSNPVNELHISGAFVGDEDTALGTVIESAVSISASGNDAGTVFITDSTIKLDDYYGRAAWLSGANAAKMLITNSDIFGAIYKPVQTHFVGLTNVTGYSENHRQAAWYVTSVLGGDFHFKSSENQGQENFAFLIFGEKAMVANASIRSEHGSCIGLWGTNGAQIVNNNFWCGDNSQWAFLVYEVTACDYSYVAGNYSQNYDPSIITYAPYLVGTTVDPPCNNAELDGSGANSQCDSTTNRGDHDPAT